MAFFDFRYSTDVFKNNDRLNNGFTIYKYEDEPNVKKPVATTVKDKKPKKTDRKKPERSTHRKPKPEREKIKSPPIVDESLDNNNETRFPAWLLKDFIDLIEKSVSENIKLKNKQIIEISKSYFSKNSPINIKYIQEVFEYALVNYLRDITFEYYNKGESSILELFRNKALKAYENQPPLTARTAESTKLQQYSTPLPLAFLINCLIHDVLDTESGFKLLEPSAGNGMLVSGTEKNVKVWANEIDTGYRTTHLKNSPWIQTVTNEDALKLLVDERQAVYVSNPPFGRYKDKVKIDKKVLPKIEQAIAYHNITNNMADGSFLVMIHGNWVLEKDSISGTKLKYEHKTFYDWLYTNCSVLANIEIDGKIYNKQGANYPIHVILAFKRNDFKGFRYKKPFKHASSIADLRIGDGTILRCKNWEDVLAAFATLRGRIAHYPYKTLDGDIPESSTELSEDEEELQSEKESSTELSEEENIYKIKLSSFSGWNIIPPEQKDFIKQLQKEKSEDFAFFVDKVKEFSYILDERIPKYNKSQRDNNYKELSNRPAFLRFFARPAVELYLIDYDKKHKELMLYGSIPEDGEFEHGYYTPEQLFSLFDDPALGKFNFLELDFHYTEIPIRDIDDDRNPHYKRGYHEPDTTDDRDEVSDDDREPDREIPVRDGDGTGSVRRGDGQDDGGSGDSGESGLGGTNIGSDDSHPSWKETEPSGNAGTSEKTQRERSTPIGYNREPVSLKEKQLPYISADGIRSDKLIPSAYLNSTTEIHTKLRTAIDTTVSEFLVKELSYKNAKELRKALTEVQQDAIALFIYNHCGYSEKIRNINAA